MSKSVVPAAAVAHAKHLVNNKKLTKRPSGHKPADTDAQAVDHKEEAANVADAKEAQQHVTSMSDAVLSDFSFAGALASAAGSTSALAAESEQAEGGYSDDDNDGSGTIVAIGAAGLAILGGVVAFSGGGGNKNKAPTVAAATQTVTTKEDTAATVTVSATDPNSDPLTYSASGATKGTVSGGTNGVFTYTPNANFSGTDTFTVTVSDGRGGSVTQTVTVNITAVNDAPVVDKATVAATTVEETALSGQTVATDVDSTTLTYAVGAAAANGTVVVDAATGKYTYTPKADFAGTDTFTVKVSDGTDSSVQTVNVTVTNTPDNPVADAENTASLTVDEDTPGEIIVAFTDPDAPTDTDLEFELVDGPDNGKLTTNAAGNLVYTPNANFNGTDSITYTVTDNNGGSTTYTVPITVTAVDDPTTGPETQTVSGTEDTAVTGTITFVDPDNVLTYQITDPADNGTVVVGKDGTFTYTPKADFNGTDTFVVTANNGTFNSVQTVTVNVAAVNDAPVADESQDVETDFGTDATVIVTATDVDGDDLTYEVLDADGPANGTITDEGNGEFTYTPDAGFTGDDSFVVTISDGNGGVVEQIVNVTVGAGGGGDTEVSLDDIPGMSPTVSVELDDAATGSVVFVDDTSKASNVVLTGFGNDDLIEVLGVASLDTLSFTTAGGGEAANDLRIDYQNTTTAAVTTIIIEDVVVNSGPIFNYSTAVSAVGFNFMQLG